MYGGLKVTTNAVEILDSVEEWPMEIIQNPNAVKNMNKPRVSTINYTATGSALIP